MTTPKIYRLSEFCEIRSQRDVKRRKELQTQATKVAQAMDSIIDLGVSDINSPEQLKELMDFVRGLVNEYILLHIIDVEVQHDLDKIKSEDE